ncbi:DUF3097 family protein [Salsipaludibacter albus]|uniref:DUF3097 family protein n=1 Tax=Salsipaludibacter albus TaxID=2849650 RepID=UPI001EE456CF|nr:DUF3097 family protein [Salsipaludibacter albus]MBY5161678.1 DUF3097 domain-containing protein [Salsipaludibacter albus]
MPLPDGTEPLRPARPGPTPRRTLARGMLVEVLGDGFAGQVTAATATTFTLTDRRGRARTFGLDTAVVVDEQVVRLELPTRSRSTAPGTTASGSVAVANRPARVARASRIWVEGRHDAELVEKVWGDDLRHEGVVVEPLHGADDLPERVRAFAPTRDRRLGILLDHVVTGSKEQRLAAAVDDPHVLVTGHPFVDVWTAVKPTVLGLRAWPEVPRDEDFKTGLAQRLGHDHPGAFWQHLLAHVTRWTDLDRRLVGAVEQLIDFTTVPPGDA